ncbi:MAG TPA: 1-deoxy-D-xylulose-5-phosphate reductoisomerase, partial [Cyclobacteriaceae bacterium]|nr:1-deoxy-D-xylulose-5-phosphate reductoisomerase [Cyclobacteriaceae bacterium]
MERKKHIAILGSTGSIGTQALEVIAAHPDFFEVEVLTAQNNAGLLIEQAMQFKPNAVVIVNESQYDKVNDSLAPAGIKVYAGKNALASVVQMDTIDLVVAALVGYSGLLPTIKAIEAGKPIALANKETLVVAGELITSLAREKGVNIYPVDSEHS